MHARHQIVLVNRQSARRLDRRLLLRLARFVLRAESVPAAEVEIAVVSDAEIAALNARYLRHRRPTDVLSFDLSEINGDSHRLFAGPPVATPRQFQVIVSADTARNRARQLGHTFHAELGLYIAHGLLHLLGYDDHRQSDRVRMHARQRELLASFGLKLKG